MTCGYAVERFTAQKVLTEMNGQMLSPTSKLSGGAVTRYADPNAVASHVVESAYVQAFLVTP